MGFGIFFLALLGGYWFNRIFYMTTYSIYRDSGYNLLFKSAISGVCLIVFSYFVIKYTDYSNLKIICQIQKYFKLTEYSNVAILAFLLGPISAIVLNSLNIIFRFKEKAIRKSENWLEILFRGSLNNEMMIEVTLENNKVYVGTIFEANDPRFDRQYFQMILSLSGFRNDRHEIIFTTNYAKALNTEENKKNLFKIIIPVSLLRSARPFDYKVYNTFQKLIKNKIV